MVLIRDAKADRRGGADGFGEKIAEYFIEEGVNVGVGDVDPERIRKTVSSLQGKSGKVEGYPCDVTDEMAVSTMVNRAVEQFGAADFRLSLACPRLPGSLSPIFCSI
jgi:NAD(P)-dependent dehydrogenase (short-subunit alcohol dehydrogenase family)